MNATKIYFSNLQDTYQKMFSKWAFIGVDFLTGGVKKFKIVGKHLNNYSIHEKYMRQKMQKDILIKMMSTI